MASSASRAGRNQAVRQRLAAASAAISERLGVALAPEPKRSKDPALQPIVELERFADFLEAVSRALEGGGGVAEHEGLTVAQLRTALVARGVDIPSGAKKDDLIALLAEAGDADGEDGA